MTPDTLQHRYEQALAALDAQIARVNRELATLAAGRPADPDVIAAAVARAQQASEAVGSLVGAAAEAVGDPPPAWATREELDTTVQRLAGRLRSAAVDRRRARLRAVAATLAAAQVIHPRWRKVVPGLDALRVRAAEQVQKAADTDDPPELPGPANGAKWLAWAWGLTPEQVEDALAAVRGSVPALAEVVLEIDPGHWVAPEPPADALEPGRSPVGLSHSDSILPALPASTSESAVPLAVPVAEVVAPPDSEAVAPSDAWIEDEPDLDSAPPAPPPRPKVTIKPVVAPPGGPAAGANPQPPAG